MLETQREPGDEAEPNGSGDEMAKLQNDFRARLIAANLRTEAVRAGMIDLDGLKLVDLTGVELDEHDKIIDGSKMMLALRLAKPWLFGRASSSSTAVAPASKPVKQKTAMEMSDEEYVAAKTAVTRYHI